MTPKSACSVIKERVERQKEKMRSSRYSEDQIIGILGSGRGQWTLEDTIQSNFPVGNTGSNPSGTPPNLISYDQPARLFRRTPKIVPASQVEVGTIVPPCAFTISLQMKRPRPRPA
jgi:hypothetical protein